MRYALLKTQAKKWVCYPVGKAFKRRLVHSVVLTIATLTTVKVLWLKV